MLSCILYSIICTEGKVLSCFSPVGLFVTQWTVKIRLLCPRDFPSKNTGVDCHALLQGSSPSSNATCVSCVCGIAGGFFTAELPGKSKGTIWMSIRIHSYSGRSDQYKLVCVCVVYPPDQIPGVLLQLQVYWLSASDLFYIGFSAQINGSFKQLFFLRRHNEALLFVCAGGGMQYDGAFLPYSSVLLLHGQCPTAASGVNSPAPDIIACVPSVAPRICVLHPSCGQLPLIPRKADF